MTVSQPPLRADTIAQGLLERSQHLEAATWALRAAREGSGRCVVLEGGAGLGKSRLVDAARELAERDGMTVAIARAGELDREVSFAAALALFEPLVARASVEERANLFAGSAALARRVLEPAVEIDWEEERAFPILHGLQWLAANVAERAPLLIAIDDAHWADAATLRFVAYLLQRLDELPVSVLVAARPVGRRDEHAGRLLARIASHRLTRTLALAPLSDAAVAELVRAELGDQADAGVRDACAEATGGNPFFLRELIRSLRASGGASPSAVADTAPGFAARAVVDRLAALPEPAGRLAAALALLGDPAPLARAAAVAGLDADAAAASADELAAAGILAPGLPLSFHHPLVRHAVHQKVPPVRRARAHARAASILREDGADTERVAAHLLKADLSGTPWALTALREAARRARARGALDAAVRYLRAAAAADPPSREAPELVAELARAEARAGNPEATQRADEALDLIEEGHERAAAALRIGMALADGGAHNASAAVLDRGLAELPEGSSGELGRTLSAARAAIGGLDYAAAAPGGLETILERTRRAEATASERLMLAHGALAKGLTGTDAAEVVRLAEGALAGLPADVASAAEVSALTLAATALVVADRLAPAERALSAAIDSARARGSVLAFATASHARAHANFRLGRLADAVADAQSVLDAARYGWEPALPAAHAVLSNSLVERGEVDAARAALSLGDGEGGWSDTFTWADYLEARARLAHARGEHDRALADCLACGERLVPAGTAHASVVPWRPTGALAALALGDHEQAARLAEEELAESRAFAAPRALGLALRTAGRVAGADRGVDLLREAVDVLAASDGRLEHAHALVDLGTVMLEESHRLAAREPLREGLDLAHRCGADALEERARKALSAAGARPRRPTVSGRDALTPRESRIATMAADGMSNREIAEALFITRKTVETHLGHAYRKLDISSREELVGALDKGSP